MLGKEQISQSFGKPGEMLGPDSKGERKGGAFKPNSETSARVDKSIAAAVQ